MRSYKVKQCCKSVRVDQFDFQKIVSYKENSINWYEMLYRPKTSGFKAEYFFSRLSHQELVDFDIMALELVSGLSVNENVDKFSVNISPVSLQNKHFIKTLEKLCWDQIISPRRVCLEVVETRELIQMTDYCIGVLKEFRQAGGWLALDDFGSGYAHWALLKLELVDVIKVVNSNVCKTACPERFLAGLSSFAKKQGLISVLEGVETIKDYEVGRLHGFEHFQGFYLGE